LVRTRFILIICLTLSSAIVLAQPSTDIQTSEVVLTEPTLQAVGETNFAPVEGDEVIEEFAVIEFSDSVETEKDPLDAVMQEAMEESTSK